MTLVKIANDNQKKREIVVKIVSSCPQVIKNKHLTIPKPAGIVMSKNTASNKMEKEAEGENDEVMSSSSLSTCSTIKTKTTVQSNSVAFSSDEESQVMDDCTLDEKSKKRESSPISKMTVVVKKENVDVDDVSKMMTSMMGKNQKSGEGGVTHKNSHSQKSVKNENDVIGGRNCENNNDEKGKCSIDEGVVASSTDNSIKDIKVAQDPTVPSKAISPKIKKATKTATKTATTPKSKPKKKQTQKPLPKNKQEKYTEDNDDDEEEIIKPKRPLNAYNLFFRHERARLLLSTEQNGGVLPPLLTQGKNASSSISTSSSTPQSREEHEYQLQKRRDKIRFLLYNNPFTTNDDYDTSSNSDTSNKKQKKKKRRNRRLHRKSHGKVSFSDLARHIAEMWKVTDDETKSLFTEFAEEDKLRHRREIEVYKKKLRERQTEKENGKKLGTKKNNQQTIEDKTVLENEDVSHFKTGMVNGTSIGVASPSPPSIMSYHPYSTMSPSSVMSRNLITNPPNVYDINNPYRNQQQHHHHHYQHQHQQLPCPTNQYFTQQYYPITMTSSTPPPPVQPPLIPDDYNKNNNYDNKDTNVITTSAINIPNNNNNNILDEDQNQNHHTGELYDMLDDALDHIQKSEPILTKTTTNNNTPGSNFFPIGDEFDEVEEWNMEMSSSLLDSEDSIMHSSSTMMMMEASLDSLSQWEKDDPRFGAGIETNEFDDDFYDLPTEKNDLNTNGKILTFPQKDKHDMVDFLSRLDWSKLEG